jgi:type IV pilus assembly protein PilO
LQAISGHVQTLEAQLPNASEMDSVLSAINQAALGRSLQFELFKPAPVEFKIDYAEQPIALRLTGSYDDIGAFAADVTNLDRIVVLTDLNLMPSPEKVEPLTLTAVMRTFRYLTPDERATQAVVSPVSGDKKTKKSHKGKNHVTQ